MRSGTHCLRRSLLVGGLSLAMLSDVRHASAGGSREAAPDNLEARFAAGRSRPLLELTERALGQIIQGFAVDPSGRRLAVFGPGPEDLTVVDVATGARLFRGVVPPLGRASPSGSPVHFSDDGETLYWMSGACRLVCFDMTSFTLSSLYEVSTSTCRSMCVDRDAAYFSTPDASVIKVDLANGRRLELTFPEGIFHVFKSRDGVYGRSPDFHPPKGQWPQATDGLPLNANRPVRLISLSAATFGEHLTLPAAAANSFFIQLPQGGWAIASESDVSGIEANGKSQLIIADTAGKTTHSVAFARGSLLLTGFALAGGRLYISAEDASEPVRAFTTEGELKASTFIHQDRLGPLGLRGAGDRLFVANLYEVVVFG